MRAYDLIELAAVIALNGRVFLRRRSRLSETGIGQYWTASRGRLDGWLRAMRAYHAVANANPPNVADLWPRIRPTLEEVFSSEILTRVWTAMACEHDRWRGVSHVSPVVRSVFLGHLDARHRALHLMCYAQDRAPDAVAELNRLRCRAERWTDMLLSHLLPECELGELAFDQKRVLDFAEDVRDLQSLSRQRETWRLLQAALEESFDRAIHDAPASASLRAQIASSILGCFEPDMFDATGLLSSLWLERLNFLTADAAALIEELLEADQPSPLPLVEVDA